MEVTSKVEKLENVENVTAQKKKPGERFSDKVSNILEKWNNMDKNGLNLEIGRIRQLLSNSSLSAEKLVYLNKLLSAVEKCGETLNKLDKPKKFSFLGDRRTKREAKEAKFKAQIECARNVELRASLDAESKRIQQLLKNPSIHEEKRSFLETNHLRAVNNCLKTIDEQDNLSYANQEQRTRLEAQLSAKIKHVGNLQRVENYPLIDTHYKNLSYLMKIEQKLANPGLLGPERHQKENHRFELERWVLSLEKLSHDNLDQKQRHTLEGYDYIIGKWISALKRLEEKSWKESEHRVMRVYKSLIEEWQDELRKEQNGCSSLDPLDLSDGAKALAQWLVDFDKQLDPCRLQSGNSTPELAVNYWAQLRCSGERYEYSGKVPELLESWQEALEAEEKLIQLKEYRQISLDEYSALQEESPLAELRVIGQVLTRDALLADKNHQESPDVIEISTADGPMDFAEVRALFMDDAIEPKILNAVTRVIALQTALDDEYIASYFEKKKISNDLNVKDFLKPFLAGEDQTVLELPAIKRTIAKLVYNQTKYAFFTAFLQDDYQAFSYLKTFLGKKLPGIKECIPDEPDYNDIIGKGFCQFSKKTLTEKRDTVQKVTELLSLKVSDKDIRDLTNTLDLLGAHTRGEEVIKLRYTQQQQDTSLLNEIIPGFSQEDVPRAGLASFQNALNALAQIQQFFKGNHSREQIRGHAEKSKLTDKQRTKLQDRFDALKKQLDPFKKKLEDFEKRKK